MTDSTDSEPFLPKVSLRWLIGLVTACAIAMAVILQAVNRGQVGWVLLTVFIASLVLPFLMYVGTFALASLFSTIGSAAMGADAPERVHVATTEMPRSRGVQDLDSGGPAE
mgnify:FL=1